MDLSSDEQFNTWWQETAVARILRAKGTPDNPKIIVWRKYLKSIGGPRLVLDVPVSQREEFVATYALIFE